jgi:hypothetical protein
MACGGGSGGGSEGSDSSGSGGSTGTTAGTTAGTTGAPTTGGTTTSGDDATASAGSTATTAATTSTDPTTGSSGREDTGTGDSSTGDGSTGDPVLVCKDVAGDYGDCAAVLGWGFDGSACALFSGCGCEPNCDGFFPDPVACASACAAAGECQAGDVEAAGIAEDPVAVGSFCDEVDACPGDDVEAQTWLQELFPGLVCEPGFPCDGDACHLQFQGEISEAQWVQICAASLLPGLDELACVVFGP